MLKALLQWWPVYFLIHSQRGEVGDAVVFPENWREGIPEDVRSAPELEGVADIPGLVASFVQLKKGSGDWKSGLSKEYQEDPSIAPIKDINSMVKSFLHAQKLVGANKVAIPGKNATKEDWEAFYASVGRPETPDLYTIPKPKDDKGADYEADKTFRATAHQLGLTDAQANGLYKYLAEVGEQEFKATEEYFKRQHTQAEEALKNEWGAAYQKKIATALRLVETFGNDDLKKELKDNGLANNIALVKMFESIGAKLLEDNLIGDGKDTSLSPSEAQAKINAIRNDKDHPYHQKGKPGHAEAVAEMQKLYNMLHPAEKV